jgi:hypothetical protein
MAMGWAYITLASVVGILLYLAIVFIEKRTIAWHSSQRTAIAEGVKEMRRAKAVG